MTDYEFGAWIYVQCNVAQVRARILASLEAGKPVCDAVHGFVNVMRGHEVRSGAERAFLAKFDRAIGVHAACAEAIYTNAKGE